MKKFLNDFAANNRDCANLDKSHLTSLFLNACQLFLNAPGPSAFRHQSKQINVALTEAVMVALMRRLEAGDPLPTPEGISSALFAVSKNEKFIESITRATADEEGVKYRLAYATKLFGAA